MRAIAAHNLGPLLRAGNRQMCAHPGRDHSPFPGRAEAPRKSLDSAAES